MRILINFATRSRPSAFLKAMENITQFTSTDNYEVVVVADVDDELMNNNQVRANSAKYKITWAYGESRNKIHAINRGVEKATKPWDILVNFSDDMEFQYPGWDIDLIKHVTNIWGGDLDFFAHFNDGFVRDSIPSMSIMGRAYYERFNYIYHPSYISLWADNEAMEVAMKLQKWYYFDEVLFKHNHPANIGLPWRFQDKQYQEQGAFNDVDKLNYLNRKSNNFGLPISNTYSDIIY